MKVYLNYLALAGMWAFARQIHCQSLADHCQELVQLRFPAISQSSEFASISPELLIEILDAGNLYLGMCL